MLRPLKDQTLLVENARPTAGGVIVDIGVWSPFLDYTVLRAPEGETEFGAGDRVIVKFTESGRKVSVEGLACRVVARDDILAVVED